MTLWDPGTQIVNALTARSCSNLYSTKIGGFLSQSKIWYLKSYENANTPFMTWRSELT